VNITWSDPEDALHSTKSGTQTISSWVAEGDAPAGRFRLYQSPQAAAEIPTPWNFADGMSVCFLYGVGLSAAKTSAEK